MFQASYSATGRYVYTVGADRTAKLWDTAELDQQNPRPRAIMRGHLKYVLTADMSPDEKMLVTGGADKALNLWEVPSGRLLGHMQGHTSDIESVAFTPNGRMVVSASEDRSVRIWSVDNQQEFAMLASRRMGTNTPASLLTTGHLERAILVYSRSTSMGGRYRGRRPNTSSNTLGAVFRRGFSNQAAQPYPTATAAAKFICIKISPPSDCCRRSS
jgi:WD40 repeat protein